MIDNERETEPWILLTNDDGADSPALPPLMRQLGTIARVQTVVPASECSWTSKMVSRFDPLELADTTIDGMSISTLSGYPADCASVGINNISASRPAIVFERPADTFSAALSSPLAVATLEAASELIASALP